MSADRQTQEASSGPDWSGSGTPAQRRRGRPRLSIGDDDSLARSLIEGDAAAAALAWRKLLPLVQRTLVRLVGRGSDVSDLTQEVFARFFQKVRGLREPAALRTFAMSIAIRRAREELKRRKVRRVYEPKVRLLYGSPLTEEWDPADRQLLTHIHTLVYGLGPLQSRIYLLRAIQDCSVTTISRMLRLAPSTIRRIFRRAELRLARRVRNDPFLNAYLAESGHETLPLEPSRPLSGVLG